MRKILLMCCGLVFVAAPAFAAEASFVPTSAWLVGPATLAMPVADAGAHARTPCVMANQYDNGFVFRYSGGRGQVMAMAVDFRQSAFKPGTRYKIRIEVPPFFSSDMQAVAYNEATLLINTTAAQGFQAALAQSPVLTLGIGSKTLEFSLAGAADGLDRVEACYNGTGGAMPAPAQTPAAAPVEEVRRNRPPAAPAEEPSAHDMLTPLPGEALPAQSSAADVSPPPAMPSSVEAMLNEAESKLNAIEPAAAAASEQAPAPAAVAAVEAVKEVAAPPGGERLAGTWSSPFALPRKLAEAKARDIMVEAPPVATASIAVDDMQQMPEPERHWRAMRGNNLREVLDVWARNENVELLWMAGGDFAVPQSLSIQGTFEAAVLNLLEQYGTEETRPVGRIYMDPGQKRKVLLIELASKG